VDDPARSRPARRSDLSLHQTARRSVVVNRPRDAQDISNTDEHDLYARKDAIRAVLKN